MKFGLSESQYNFILANIVKPLESLGATVWCYGSRARGDNQEFSDLDLMIENDAAVRSEINQIREKLTNSNFPYKVDLVPFSEFAETYKTGYEKDKKLFN